MTHPVTTTSSTPLEHQEIFENLWQEVVDIHGHWQVYRESFGHSEERWRRIYDSLASEFLDRTRRLLIDHVTCWNGRFANVETGL